MAEINNGEKKFPAQENYHVKVKLAELSHEDRVGLCRFLGSKRMWQSTAKLYQPRLDEGLWSLYVKNVG